MATRRSSASTTLAKTALELSAAAPLVVAHRVNRLLAAGPHMSTRDLNECMLMGSEKVIAFYQSWGAMWLQACQLQASLMMSMWTPFPMTTRGAKKTWNQAVSRNTEAIAKILSAGLKPVHSTALSNSRRLARKHK